MATGCHDCVQAAARAQVYLNKETASILGRKLCADIPTGCSMCRKAELITQSRDWIRPEDLDRRIEEVLNYPTKMFR